MDGFQAAKSVYLNGMSGMKQILNMGEIKFGDRNSASYKFFKKVVMDEVYDSMSRTFSEMEAAGLVKKCPCGTSVREGYKKCDLCNGAGYCNTDEFSKFKPTK
jgi:hypothetical protein